MYWKRGLEGGGHSTLLPRGAGTACLALCTALGACEADRTPAFEYPVEPVTLAAELFDAGDHLGYPVGLAPAGSYLVVIDHAGEKNVHVYEADSGRLIRSIGSVGEGPAEFRQPIAIVHDAEGGVWIVDSGEQRATPVDLTRVDDGDAWAGDVVSLGSVGVIDAVRTRSGTWIVESLSTEGRFALFEDDGDPIGFAGEVPRLEGFSPVAGRMSVWSSLGAHPGLERFVAAGRLRSTVIFLDEDARPIGEARVPVRTDPAFSLAGSALSLEVDSPIAYLDIATSDRYVYALFGGRTEGAHGAAQSFGRDIHVFDWEGALQGVLRLDRDAFTIDVDEDRGWLYAVQLEPLPAILRFPLPTLPTVIGAN